MPYDPNFIAGESIPLPKPTDRVKASAYQNGQFIEHSRYSLLFNRERGLAACTAHNIDGGSMPDSQHSSRSFKLDPKITPKSLQTDNERGYKGAHNPWDRGHMVRRNSMSWGDPAKAKIAERESDFYSNISPQHSKLHSAAWGKIEDWMLEHAEDDGGRACVFTGPVFTEDDPQIINLPGEEPLQIPAGFWKIISIKKRGIVRSAAFLVWQRDYDTSDPLPFAPVLEQVRITTIEVLTGLSFSALRNFDPLLFNRDRVAISTAMTSRGSSDRGDAMAESFPMPTRSTSSPFNSGSPLEMTDDAWFRVAQSRSVPKVGSNIFGSADILL